MIFGPDIDAVVFDMDGVLWHSGAIHAAAYRAALEAEGLAMPDYATIAGRRTDEVMRDLLAQQRPGQATADAVATLTAAKQSRARALLRERPPVDPACAEVVAALARSKAVALASSASAGTVDVFLDASSTRGLFGAVVTGEDIVAAKPDPAIYLEALRRLRCTPGRAAVVEDAPTGVRAALGAGVAAIVGVAGTVPVGELAAAGARPVIRSLMELIAT
jgi:beta-phosphoglucomutase